MEDNNNTNIAGHITEMSKSHNARLERGQCALRPVLVNNRVAASAELPVIAVVTAGDRSTNREQDMGKGK